MTAFRRPPIILWPGHEWLSDASNSAGETFSDSDNFDLDRTPGECELDHISRD